MSFDVVHNTDLRLQAFLEFMSGYGQRRQQVADQEAQWRRQDNQQLGQGLGQGLGSFLNVFSQDATANRASAREMAQMAAQQRGQQASLMALENQRTANDRLQASDAALLQAYGAGGPAGRTPSMTFGPGAMQIPQIQQPPQIGDTTGEFGMSRPDLGLSQQFPQEPPPQPAPPREPINPMYASEYNDLKSERAAIERNLTEKSKYAPPEEMASIKFAAARDLMRIIPRMRAMEGPAPPKTEAELIEAGPHNGGFAVLGDGTRFAYDSKGDPHWDKPAQSVAKQRPGSFPGPDGKPIQFAPNSAYLQADGSRYITNENGTPTWHKAEGDDTFMSYPDYAKLRSYDKLDSNGDKTGEKIVPSYEQYLRDKRQASGLSATLDQEDLNKSRAYQSVLDLGRTMETGSVSPDAVGEVLDLIDSAFGANPPKELSVKLAKMMRQAATTFGGASLTSDSDYSNTSKGQAIEVLRREVAAKEEKELERLRKAREEEDRRGLEIKANLEELRLRNILHPPAPYIPHK